MRNISLVKRTDSYKVSHWPVMPKGTQFVYSYLESRGGKFSETVFFGLYYYIKEYLSQQITMKDIDEAEVRFKKHFGTSKIFNREGWEHIVKVHNGYLPLRIKAVAEGTVVPTRNVLMTIENTDPFCFWLTNYVETLLLKVWYPITVATISREAKKIILNYLVKTGDPAGLPFKLHDFGYRGVSSEESAAIGGAAHLVNFLGSDTLIALDFIEDYYGEDNVSWSIPATEHMVMMAEGEEGEIERYKTTIETFKDLPIPAFAIVSDTYDLWRAASDYLGTQLKGEVEALTDKVLVVRPDSGDPNVIVYQLLETLDKAFGHTVNAKGYKVLNHVRVIQGDGVNLDTIESVLQSIEIRKYSADNVAFGMGGALLQQCNRDTQRFAIKASSFIINGVRKDYRKNPVTDSAKRSKIGRLKLVLVDGVYTTLPSDEPSGPDQLITVFENGKVLVNPTFTEIRDRAKLEVPHEEFSVS